MKAKIRKCLFVGLGGTGMTSLLHTKKVFVETYGEVPPMIGFLGIDTDSAAYDKELPTKYGNVGLEPNEQMAIKVSDAQSILRVQKDRFGWIPEANHSAMKSMTQGAGQVRTNGRFALTCNYDKVCNKVNDVLDSINNADNRLSDKYEIVGNGKLEIHLVFSVSGGTGCGTFINMAYLLKDLLSNYSLSTKLIGYGILPDVFHSMLTNGVVRVRPNAYGAIQDLDYLMHLSGSLTGKQITIDLLKESRSYDYPPFDAFFFVDNKTLAGDTYNQVDQLAEMISLALITSTGALGSATGSTMDNVEKDILSGDFNMGQKKAWVSGMGVCEILYRGDELAKVYSLKASKRMIERMLNKNQDVDALANNWIGQVDIDEHNGDPVIDFLLNKTPNNSLPDINNKIKPKEEIETFITASKVKDDQVQTKYEELVKKVFPSFDTLIINTINTEGGVANCEGLIMSIQKHIDLFMSEMRNEKEECLAKRPVLQQRLDSFISDFSEYADRFFKTKSTLEEKEEDVRVSVKKILENEREIVRRDYAIKFYNAFNGKLNDARTKIENIKSIFSAVTEEFTKEIVKLQDVISKSGSQTFQIDLASKSANNITVNDDEIVMSDFIGRLSGNKVYDFNSMESVTVKTLLLDYCDTLSKVKEFKEKTIDSVFDAMSDEEFNNILQLANAKSQVLLPYDTRGHIAKQDPADSYYIGVPDKGTSRFIKNDAFKNTLKGDSDVTAADLGIKDRVIVYHQMGVIPPFAIKSVRSCIEPYKEYGVRCHIDSKIYSDMIREKYSLDPVEKMDDTIEIWVKGIIFGLIRHSNGEYEYRDEKNGDALDDYWISLDEYRDRAYDLFKNKVSDIRDAYEKDFDKKAKDKGDNEMKALLADVKDNYWLNYSQIDMDKNEIKKHGNERIADLFRKELDYIKKLTDEFLQ